MQYRLIILLFLISANSVFAQKQTVKNLPGYDSKKLHFGFTIGLNSFDFNVFKSDIFFDTSQINLIYAIENNRSMGFHLGPISNLRLGEYFDLRLLINLSFGQRDLAYKLPSVEESGTYNTYTMKIASTYLEFPLLLKYKAARLNNFRPYLLTGINPKFDLASRKKPKESEMPKIQLNMFDPHYEVGFGIDWYLFYFKFSTEIKFSSGFMNMLVPDGTQYSRSIDKLSSKAFLVSFHFE